MICIFGKEGIFKEKYSTSPACNQIVPFKHKELFTVDGRNTPLLL